MFQPVGEESQEEYSSDDDFASVCEELPSDNTGLTSAQSYTNLEDAFHSSTTVITGHGPINAGTGASLSAESDDDSSFETHPDDDSRESEQALQKDLSTGDDSTLKDGGLPSTSQPASSASTSERPGTDRPSAHEQSPDGAHTGPQHPAPNASETTDTPLASPHHIHETLGCDEDERFMIKDLDNNKRYIVDDTTASAVHAHDKEVGQALKDLDTGRLTLFEYDVVTPPGEHEPTPSSDPVTKPNRKKQAKAYLSKVKGFMKKNKSKSYADGDASIMTPRSLSVQQSREPSGINLERYGEEGTTNGPACDGASSFQSDEDSSKNGGAKDHHSMASTQQKPAGPGSIRTSAVKKISREFTDVQHVQTLKGHAGAVWVIAFNQSARHMASGGSDKILRVWQVCREPNSDTDSHKVDSDTLSASQNVPANREQVGVSPVQSGSHIGTGFDRIASQFEGESNGSDLLPLLFGPQPLKELVGHTDVILDIAWSNLYILSSSMDMTVRMWHVQMDMCLKTFKHDNYVTASAFHPRNIQHFVSASYDGKVRLWRCADPAGVRDWAQTQNDSVTCLTFSGSGDKVLVGTQNGKFRVFNVLNSLKLEFQDEVDVRDSGKRKAENRVVGLKCLASRPEAVLVTTKDSRIRLYDNYRQVAKYKGHNNVKSKIAASFSADGSYVICGSDDGAVYIWRTNGEQALFQKSGSQLNSSDTRVKNASYESFKVFNRGCTVAAFAPARMALPLSEFQDYKMGPMSAKSTASLKEALRRRKGSSLTEDDVEVACSTAATNVARVHASSRIVVATGYNGEICVYENRGAPAWL